MDSREKELLGYFLGAIGQTMSAIASTPYVIKEQEMSTKIDLLVNIWQAIGSALIADSEEESSFEKLGNEVEAIGNLVTVISFLAPVSDEDKEELNHKGDIIQTLGVIIGLPDGLKEGLTLDILLDTFGQLIQVIEFQGVYEEFINMLGEWSQAFASIISLVNAIQNDLQ